MPWCSECHGNDLGFNANVWIDHKKGTHVVGDYWDEAYCGSCDESSRRWRFKPFDQWSLFNEDT